MDWLPKEAHDISYYREEGVFWRSVYECTISLEALADYAEKKEWKLTKQREFSTSKRLVLSLPPLRKDGDYYHEALTYSDIEPNGGGITVIYDIELQRLLVYKSAN